MQSAGEDDESGSPPAGHGGVLVGVTAGASQLSVTTVPTRVAVRLRGVQGRVFARLTSIDVGGLPLPSCCVPSALSAYGMMRYLSAVLERTGAPVSWQARASTELV